MRKSTTIPLNAMTFGSAGQQQMTIKSGGASYDPFQYNNKLMSEYRGDPTSVYGSMDTAGATNFVKRAVSTQDKQTRSRSNYKAVTPQ